MSAYVKLSLSFILPQQSVCIYIKIIWCASDGCCGSSLAPVSADSRKIELFYAIVTIVTLIGGWMKVHSKSGAPQECR